MKGLVLLQGVKSAGTAVKKKSRPRGGGKPITGFGVLLQMPIPQQNRGKKVKSFSGKKVSSPLPRRRIVHPGRAPLLRRTHLVNAGGMMKLRLEPGMILKKVRETDVGGKERNMQSLLTPETAAVLTLRQAASSARAETIQTFDVNQLLDQLEGQIKLQVAKDLQRAEIRLEPPELGRVAIQLHMEGQRLSVVLSAEKEQVNQQMQQWLETLRQNLRVAGIEVEQLQVRSDNQGGFTGDGRWRRQEEHSAEESGPSPVGESGTPERQRRFGYNSFEIAG